MNDKSNPFGLPFLYGMQFYRAPTPRRECWDGDLAAIKAMGCNVVKFWVQWRWSEREEGVFLWDDLEELMALASKHGLKVVLNLILDVMPSWVERDYPETLMVDMHGRRLPSTVSLCRQLGGYPGPCHCNELMREKRARFTRAAIERFKSFPALLMWDVWNEPESHLAYRHVDRFPELCYCSSCEAGFRVWLLRKYKTIQRLNEVWGRCYSNFEEVELPRDVGAISDFIDWREFHVDSLTADGKWRLDLVRELDPARVSHLHIVPNVGAAFAPLTAIDDFAMARECEIYGSSMVNDPTLCAQAISSAQGRYFYNAEWHVNYGGNAMYQRVFGFDRFLYELLPQLGWGVRGLLYWQYRAETLGLEAPAWGVVRPDGSSRPVAEHAARFIKSFAPRVESFMRCSPPKPKVLIWRGVRNELFQFCRHGKLEQWHQTLKSYCELLYSLNVPFGFVDSWMLEHGFADDASLLVLPQAYYVERRDAALFDAFLEKGKTVLSEGNLAAYSSSDGAFCPRVPGCGLAEKWGLFESEAVSSYHLPVGGKADLSNATGDVKKALEATGVRGSEFFKLVSRSGVSGDGAIDFASIDGESLETLASFRGTPCVVKRKVGKGCLLYAGTMLGYGAKNGRALLREILLEALSSAGIAVDLESEGLHLDLLSSKENGPEMAVCSNVGSVPKTPSLPPGEWTELFERGLLVKPGEAFLFVKD